MLYIAKVKITVYPYMENIYKEKAVIPVEAESEDEVRRILEKHYEGKSDRFYKSYGVTIQDVQPLLTAATVGLNPG
jgi:ribosome-binding ATPase YchF (GTP1/OBG family)